MQLELLVPLVQHEKLSDVAYSNKISEFIYDVSDIENAFNLVLFPLK